MNYMVVFIILGLALIVTVGTVNAQVDIKIDEQKAKIDEVETATFGLG